MLFVTNITTLFNLQFFYKTFSHTKKGNPMMINKV
jgi:hypothetical protein